MNLQDRIRAEPLDQDLSWTTWYGFSVLSGWQPRSLEIVKVNEFNKHLVRDSMTKRLFIHDPDQGGIVQYFPDLDAEMFEA